MFKVYTFILPSHCVSSWRISVRQQNVFIKFWKGLQNYFWCRIFGREDCL